MSCEHPILAYRVRSTEIFGKSKLFFNVKPEDNILSLKEKYGQDNVFEFPCCKCDECRKDYAEEWSIRLTLERKFWKYGYFITLTYDNNHNPSNFICSSFLNGSLEENVESIKNVYNYWFKDIQKFLKVCRFHLGSICYYGVSELGETTSRLHYHLILMSNKPIDLYDGSLSNGYLYYKSDFIKNHWKFGSVYKISEFSSQCAAYVAKYTLKDKVKAFMSRNIGKRYFLSNYQKIVDNSFIIYEKVGNRDMFRCPSFMLEWFKDLNDLNVDDTKFDWHLYNSNLLLDKQINLNAFHPEQVKTAQNRINYKTKKRGDL